MLPRHHAPGLLARSLPRLLAPAALLTVGLLGLSGCVDANTPEPWPIVSPERFACTVQPVLTAQCSAPACHGNPKRRMQVLAPGRMRMIGELQRALLQQSAEDREAGLHPPLTKAELDFNLIQARGMIRGREGEGWTDIPLLAFPLAVGAGGVYHAPNGDVFASEQDPGFIALSQWAAGLKGCP